MIEMIVAGVRVPTNSVLRLLLLKEKEGERYLTISIGQSEAEDIARVLKGTANPRPDARDLLVYVLEKYVGKIWGVIINDLANDTFYAQIDMHGTGIDARSSDAVAVALRVGAPIFVAEEVLSKAGVRLDLYGQVLKPSDEPTEQGTKVSPAFRTFIEGLNLDDFDDRGR